MKYSNPYAKHSCIKRGCPKVAYARSLCKSHYEHLKRHGRSLNQQQLRLSRRSVNDASIENGVILMKVGSGIVKLDADPKLMKLVFRRKWSLGGNGYPLSKHQYLHHLVIGKHTDLYVDHINRDKLDNRRSNLRLVTPEQNTWNFTPRNQSGHRNVFADKQTGKWRVLVKRQSFGRFETLEEAVAVANRARRMYYGEEFA